MKKTYLLAGVSVLLWSTLATVSKLMLGTMSSEQLLCVSSLFAVAVLLLFCLFTGRLKKFKELSFKDIVIIILIGLPGTFLYNEFLFLGTARMQASQAFIINYLWPIMSVVFACILLKEKLSRRKGIAIVMSFLGVITVAGGNLLDFDAGALIGAGFCVLAAVSYGAFTALNKKWHYDKWISMMLSFAVAFFLSLIICLTRGTDWTMNAGEWLGSAWNGIFVLAIATVTWALALDGGNTAKISNLAYITPFLSLVWTALVLGEMPSVWSVGGLCLIVAGIFIQLIPNKNK